MTLWHEPPTFSSSIRKKMKEGVDVEKFRNDEGGMSGMSCAAREDKGDREGIPHTAHYSIGNSSRVIFRIGIKLPPALRGCFVEVLHD